MKKQEDRFDRIEIPVSVRQNAQAWKKTHQPLDITGYEDLLIELIEELIEAYPLQGDTYNQIMRQYSRRGLPWLNKAKVQQAYQDLCDQGLMSFDPDYPIRLQMKPTRSQAGVAVVTVLTKPYPCPGKCIFCPTDVRMPKSYLHDEPGAQRAERHAFDPYEQTFARINTLDQLGHPTDKIELLILGGTWSSYRRDYQEWFIKRCFDAMNGVDSPDLRTAQELNSNGDHRNVGLVVETRQDHIDADELRWFRYLGVTKVQVGIQSLDEHVLAINNRGHDVQATRDSFRLLRLGGFKIHAHWMPNLLGATPESDIADAARLWDDLAVRPDELKIYPCSLLENAELYDYWLRGEYKPYTEEEVLHVLVEAKALVPRWVRLNRVIRDIPTTNVVEGNKKANLRQVAQQVLKKEGRPCQCIRCREVRRQQIVAEELTLKVDSYATDVTTEHFLSFETPTDHIAGFLRLSLPNQDIPHPIPELQGHAMIREVHVYGPALPIGEDSQGEAQHIGLGSQLIIKAKELAQQANFKQIAVISAIGTREYYTKHQFELGIDDLYMIAPL
ncbi:MAG TPA: tRNA uridine(34) 5-carboxymethylaminomethyl modification radical SAM/GNAT enzyme Elp3 [Anaerolineae bacterium]|nr:tRNA uridine(34) 5-carboxymethylaminomethyl modification radical SAM/GNAT enzyme Elp3 [Anaerolineae bacterium]